MADDLNPAIIKRTQHLLGKYVKKPSLTEKLLKKPPFRFIHDVFSVIIRDTGCFVDLYIPEELNFENIKDRDDKIRFLQKMIDVVKLTTNSQLMIRTSKIVAGQEPEKTNELFQLIGEIIEKKLDWKTAVEQVLLGKNQGNETQTQTKTQEKNNKAIKEPKTKDKPREKELQSKDSKSIKTSSKSIKSSNKDDKNKRTTEKKKSSGTKLTTAKDKIPKGNKEQDKTTNKSSKEAASTISTKLTKHESQSSNKSSSSPNSKESKTSITPVKIENIEDNQEVVPQLNEVKKIENLINNEVALDTGLNNTNLDPSVNEIQRERQRSSFGKAKKTSAQTRKPIENDVEQLQGNEYNNISFESVKNSQLSDEKTEIKTNHIKQETSTTSTSPQKQLSPPISLTNEVKRESTFTRENSKESSSNQSSIAIRPRTSLRPPSARPPSARPGAPRRRDKNIEIILQPNEQIKMSGIQVKLENFGDLDDDGENLVIIDNPNAIDVLTGADTNTSESEKMLQDETLEQGHLVQQILETQKDLTQQNDASGQQKKDKDSTIGLAMRQTSARHMNNLRDVIQNLTKSVNPLGKLMDFIPEDIDAMQLEFTMWRDAYTLAANELKRERSLTESATEPMKNQLIQIEVNLSEYLEMIDASRVKILQNSEKILKMLTTP